MISYEDKVAYVDKLEEAIEEVIKEVLNNTDKQACIRSLTVASYEILTMINIKRQANLEELNYLMGHTLPLLETLIEEKEEEPYEQFRNNLATKMRDYYKEFIKDMRAKVELHEAAIQGRH